VFVGLPLFAIKKNLIRSRRFVTLVVCNRRDGSYIDAESYFRRTKRFVYLLAELEFRRH